MRKSYKFKKRQTQVKKFAYNWKIRALNVVVIDEAGEQLGEMTTRDAINIAQERGFDLVEVQPTGTPPICKIMNYGSFQYKREKQIKKQKAQAKTLDVKSIRISLKIGDHDKQTRIKQANKFLEKGHKIKIELILRGREFTHLDLARQAVREFKDVLDTPTIVEQDVTKQGNKLFIILIPENQAKLEE
jgi:translation initiation factor IF-3